MEVEVLNGLGFDHGLLVFARFVFRRCLCFFRVELQLLRLLA